MADIENRSTSRMRESQINTLFVPPLPWCLIVYKPTLTSEKNLLSLNCRLQKDHIILLLIIIVMVIIQTSMGWSHCH